MAKMGGPWIPLPGEVITLLRAESYACAFNYILMVEEFFVEEIRDTDGIWVAGRIHASKYDVSQRLSMSTGHFYDKIWPRWEEIGIVEIKDGGIYLPKLYKKGDEHFQTSQMKAEINQLKANQGKMQLTIQKLLKILSNQRNVITTIPSGDRKDPYHSPEGSFRSPEGPLSLLGYRSLKISLSKMNKLISKFYRSIGQKRIPGPVREKSIKTFQDLMKGGYKPGEIEFALEWIPENAEEPVKHFGIVPHMIEQALEVGRKELEIQEAEQAQQEAREEAERNRLDEREEIAALENYKGQLPESERGDLRNKALDELRAMKGITNEWISDVLVEAQENEIIRKAGIDLAAFRDPGDGEDV